MPIVIQQPDMVSPQISSGYGAAEQWSRDLPSLVHQQTAIAAANQSYGHQVAQAQLQSGALAAHAGLQNAGIAAHSRESALNRDFQMGQNEWQHNADMAKAEQHAELATWVNQQDMTQADNMRLQRLNQGVSRVQEQMASGQLTAEEGADLITQLRTGIDPLNQRVERMKVKLLKAESEKYDAQTTKEAQHNEAMKQFSAESTQKHTANIYNPAVLERLGRQFDEANPGLMAAAALVPGGVEMAQASRQKAIEAHAAEDPDGILGNSVETAPGKKDIQWRKDQKEAKQEHPSGLTPAEYRKEYSETARRVEKMAVDDKKANPDNPEWTRERIKAEIEKDMTEIHHLPANFEEYHKMSPGGGKKASADNPFMPKPATPAGGTTNPSKETPPPEVAFAESRAAIQERTDLPPEVRGRVLTNLDTDLKLINKAGGFKKLDEATQKAIIKRGMEVEQVLKTPKPPPAGATPQSPRFAQQPANEPDWMPSPF